MPFKEILSPVSELFFRYVRHIGVIFCPCLEEAPGGIVMSVRPGYVHAAQNRQGAVRLG